MTKFKQFIPLSKRRMLRRELIYQVIMEDICNVFEAGEVERKRIQDLINGIVEQPLDTEKVKELIDDTIAKLEDEDAS